MSTERERLRAWMAANGYDALDLQAALGMAFAIHKYIDSDHPWPINDGIRYRFLDTFGEDALTEVFGHDCKDRLAKYAAQCAVTKAVAKGQLAPVRTCRCRNCGQQAAQYHHPSYATEHRLNVIPLCCTCHRRHHSNRNSLNVDCLPIFPTA